MRVHSVLFIQVMGYLIGQAISPLVWLGRAWIANQGLVSGSNKLRSRDIMAEDEGTLYAAAPFRWRYPDMITVNGTKYSCGSTEDLEHRSQLMRSYMNRTGQ